jgi:hypothetical protein
LQYNRHRALIERMYEDRATISRHVEVEKLSGETVLSEAPVPVFSNVPCRLSQTNLGRNDQTEAQNDIRYEVKLFISPDVVISQGDVIVVTRGRITATGWEPIGEPRSYTAGEPFPPYSTHQEVSLQRDGYA